MFQLDGAIVGGRRPCLIDGQSKLIALSARRTFSLKTIGGREKNPTNW
jgi:hypothetical protein